MAIAPELLSDVSHHLDARAPAGEDFWRGAVRALLADRTEARRLLAEARWFITDASYPLCGAELPLHARAVHLVDALAGFLDPPHPTPAELDAALAAEAARPRPA